MTVSSSGRPFQVSRRRGGRSRPRAFAAALALALAAFATPAAAIDKDAEWQDLTRQLHELVAKAKPASPQAAMANYAKALAIARKALQLAKGLHDPDHGYELASLQNLVRLHLAMAQPAEALPLAKSFAELKEKVRGPDHPEVVTALSELASIYIDQGDFKKAKPILKRILVTREESFGPDHPDVHESAEALADACYYLGQVAEAEQLHKRYLSLLEKELGPDHAEVGKKRLKLAWLYIKVRNYSQGDPLFAQGLASLEKALGADHPDIAASLDPIANAYRDNAQAAKAEALSKRALAIREKHFGSEHPDVAHSLRNLAVLYADQGNYAEAESHYRRALLIFEKILGMEHRNVASTLQSLAVLYQDQGQPGRAEPLLQRALQIQEKILGPDHLNTANTVNSLAVLLANQGRYPQAEALHRRALAIREKSLGPKHDEVAVSLINLASLLEERGEYGQARSLLQRALAIAEIALGPTHPQTAATLNNLASVYEEQGLLSQAESHYKRALDINQKVLIPEHPTLAISFNNLARFYQKQGNYSAALPYYRRATAIYRQRILAGGAGDTAIREASANRRSFIHHLSILARNPLKESPSGVIDEGFQVVQLEQATGTGAAVARMAARFAQGDDAVAALVKRKQDAVTGLAQLEGRLMDVAGLPPAQRNSAAEETLRNDIAAGRKELAAIDGELTSRFPEYQELTRPEPLPIREVQAMLEPDEAMLAYAVGEESAWLWLVRSNRAELLPLDTSAEILGKQVKDFRAQMDVDSPIRLDLRPLHGLYQSIFAPAVPHLEGIHHLILVPAGPLQSLPFAALVASAPKTPIISSGYQQVDWLVRRYAFSVLPSVGSLRALRKFASRSVAEASFIGFGDPVLRSEDAGQSRAVKTKLNLGGLFRAPVKTRGNSSVGIADVKLIRQQPSLPETADELRAMARTLNAGQEALWLQRRATESNVRSMDLSRYRTIAFATHGVMAGEVGKGMEPGLILTPPAEGSPADDGYLTAGEIAKLRLNADWVLLSACNTAASDGTPGAEGMSGLAKAFFYAGSRTLLISHWPVASEATVPLTTAMLREYETNPRQGKAEAQRKAMVALMDTPDHPEYGHPLFWAPFIVAGEGGSGRRASAGR